MSNTQFWGIFAGLLVFAAFVFGLAATFLALVAAKRNSARHLVWAGCGWLLAIPALIIASAFAGMAKDGSGGLIVLMGLSWAAVVVGVIVTIRNAYGVIDNRTAKVKPMGRRASGE